MGRRRAVSLILVHLLILGHIAHWWLAGSTLTPLEPSEASFSLLDGAVNAGAIFLGILILSTLVFGRFFCGWACHVVAYQDLARWILMKCRIRPKPVRSRLLFLVPLFAAYWLYIQPLVARWWNDRGTPAGYELSMHLTKDDFWETFPGPTVAILTFLVCGFIIIYFLGSKGFCFYGCPYGGIFGVADRFARGRIRVTEDCDGSSVCTATCSSNVDVAREVREFGMVVDPGCLKCMDCISVCPNEALYFGFGPRAPRGARPSEGRKARPPSERDFTWPEEIALAIAFAAAFVMLNGLYRVVPLLLAVGLSSIVAYSLLVAARCFYATAVRVQNLNLKGAAGITRGGRIYLLGMAVAVLLLVHSGWIQWHAHRGAAAFDSAKLARLTGEQRQAGRLMEKAERHLTTCLNYGLIHTSGVGRMLGEICLWTDRPHDAIRHFQDELDAGIHQSGISGAYVPILLGEALRETGRTEESIRLYRRALPARLRTPDRVLHLGRALVQEGKHLAAREVLSAGLKAHPADGNVALETCKLLLRSPDESLRDPAEALRVAERTNEAADGSHADLLSMLAYLYAQSGRPQEALAAARRSLEQARAQGLESLASDMERMVREYREAARGPSESARQ